MKGGIAMTLEEHYRLSFYQPVHPLGDHENIWLVRHAQTGKLYVRKELSDYNRGVYETLRRMNSCFFPKIYELTEEDGHLIVIEEYLDGETLEAYRMKKGRLTMEEIQEPLEDVCSALMILHREEPPIIHRDIKPSNILKGADGKWKIIDFDTARHYDAQAQRDTTFLGTKAYAAPEQFGDLQTDVRTDIYAVGAMTNYLLTGASHKKQMYHGAAEEMIVKCTQFDPNRRYQNVESLLREIQKWPVCRSEGEKTKNFETDETVSEDVLKNSAKSHGVESEICGGNGRTQERNPAQQASHIEHDSGFFKKQRPFLPPGYRSGSLWKASIASLMYFLIFWCCLTMEVTDEAGNLLNGSALLINHIGSLVLCLLLAFFWFNYGNVQRYLPLVRSSKRALKIIGYIVWSLVIIFGVVSAVIAMQ